MTTPVVELREVALTFNHGGRTVHALSGVTVGFASGTSAAIVGRSGSGKSSLVAVAGLMRAPSHGTVIIDGTPVTGHERARTAVRARTVAMIFQSFHLDPRLTAQENCMLPWFLGVAKHTRSKAARRADNLLERVGIAQLARRPIHAMSGGERQRVAIARALFSEPRLLIADEPTGNLDEDTAANIRALLFSLPTDTGASVVVVTHDMEVARGADRILRLERGKLVGRDQLQTAVLP